MYKEYFNYCLEDKKISDTEKQDLDKLKKILGLKHDQVVLLQNEVSKKLYETEVARVVDDGRLNENEKKFLEQLREDILIKESIAENVYAEAASGKIQEFSKGLMERQRLSPDEEKELYAMADSLGVEINMDDESKYALKKFKQYWIIENGELPVIEDPPINITRGEKCYFHTACDWYENRKHTKRINYHGPTYRLKIAKGLYYRMGSIQPQVISEDVLTHIDTADIYLTSKRLIFMGSKGNKTIRLNKILDMETYSNGVTIQKDAGRSPFLAFSDNNDVFYMTLARAMRFPDAISNI